MIPPVAFDGMETQVETNEIAVFQAPHISLQRDKIINEVRQVTNMSDQSFSASREREGNVTAQRLQVTIMLARVITSVLRPSTSITRRRSSDPSTGRAVQRRARMSKTRQDDHEPLLELGA